MKKPDQQDGCPIFRGILERVLAARAESMKAVQAEASASSRLLPTGVLLRAIASADGTVLDAADIVPATGGVLERRAKRCRSRLDALSVAEAIEASYGNVTEAARKLGVPRSTLRGFMRSQAQ